MGFLVRSLVTAVSIFVASLFLPGIHWGQVDYGMGDAGRYLSLLLTAVVLGVVNAFVRPVLLLISFPLTCATLGLFVFVINALMLILVSLVPQLGFTVDGFLTALIGSIVISIVSGVLSRVVS
jgi:putative membrane protein